MRSATDPAIAAQPFAADVAPLPADYARCYDWPLCPLSAHCRRTEPVPPNTLASMSMFFAMSKERGGCEHFIDREARA